MSRITPSRKPNKSEEALSIDSAITLAEHERIFRIADGRPLPDDSEFPDAVQKLEARIPNMKDAEHRVLNEVRAAVEVSYQNNNAGVYLSCPLESQSKTLPRTGKL